MALNILRTPASLDGELPRRHRPDYSLVILIAILLTIGLVVIYAISPALGQTSGVSANYYINKQLLSVLLGVIVFGVTAAMPINVWRRLQTPLLVIAGLSAIAVRLFGQQVLGAYRWIQIGGFSIQSAEIIKLALLIWLAGFLSERIRSGSLTDFKQTMRPLMAVVLALGVVVAGFQSDLGSTGVMIAMMAAMAFVAGLPMKRLIIVGLIIVTLVASAISLTPYRRSRLATFLHPTADCLTTGYQSCQALISVGSGGLIGVGLSRDVQAHGYLPEAANDSIFAIYSEQFGFVGDIVLLGLFIALFARLRSIIERAPDNFTRLVVVGILAWLSTQSIINIGAMIGLLPLKGITLPFISYGGTSVVFVMAAMGLVFQVSRYTLHSVPATQMKGRQNDYRSDRRRVRGAYNAPASGRARA